MIYDGSHCIESNVRLSNCTIVLYENKTIFFVKIKCFCQELKMDAPERITIPVMTFNSVYQSHIKPRHE